MDYQMFNINYASLKRRGINGNYTYILTSHKYPVRKNGFEDSALLKNIYSSMPKIKIYDNDNNHFISATDENVRFASSVARSKSKVLQLASNNNWDYFVTLTFDKCKIDRYNLKEIKKVLLKFFDNYRQRKSADFRYLLVPEQHKDGAFHFHGLFYGVQDCDLFVNEFGYMDFMPYKNKFGFCSLSAVKDLYKCANYVTKYISKDMFNSVPDPHTHLYFCSRGLKCDEVLKVGSLNSTFNTDNLFCSDTEFCIKYYSNSNVFENVIVPYTNTVKPISLKDIDIKSLQHKALFDFCNSNGLTINMFTNLDSLYNSLKDDIITAKLNEYELLKQQLKSEIIVFNSNFLTEDEEEAIKAIFVHNVINDELAAFPSTTNSSVNLCIFDKTIGVDYNALE